MFTHSEIYYGLENFIFLALPTLIKIPFIKYTSARPLKRFSRQCKKLIQTRSSLFPSLLKKLMSTHTSIIKYVKRSFRLPRQYGSLPNRIEISYSKPRFNLFLIPLNKHLFLNNVSHPILNSELVKQIQRSSQNCRGLTRKGGRKWKNEKIGER